MATACSSTRPSMLTEEYLLGEIAYCKARLADIHNAPESSLHRQALAQVAERLHRTEALLSQLRQK